MAAIIAPRDEFDRTCQFFKEQPKNCFKTLLYTAEWSKVFFENLKNYPELTIATKALSAGKSLFVIPEFFTDINSLKNITTNWARGIEINEQRIPIKKVIMALGDVTGKTCELGKWLVETKIITLSSIIASRMTIINGASMMFGFSNKIYYETHDELK